jgi:hypothetical protein
MGKKNINLNFVSCTECRIPQVWYGAENIIIKNVSSETGHFKRDEAAGNLIIIQFNSILYYLRAESTAVRPITDTAQRTRK